jgi:NADH-quinone oxidoreductase subunit M
VSHWPLLSLVTFLPLVGVFFILVARGDEAVVARNARFIALWTSLIVFLLSIMLWVDFNPNTASFQFVERSNWITLGGVTIAYHMGIDGISLFFILLSTLLTFLSIVSSWVVIRVQVREYMIAFLALETLMVGIFCALDFILFYVFFEAC